MLSQYPKSAALAAGVLAATGFAPLDLWPVTLACLALLAQLIESAPSPRAAFARGWWFGVGHFTLGLNWIAHAFTFQDSMPHWFGYPAVFLLSLYLAVYPAMGTLAAWWGARRLGGGFTLLFAASWMLSEYARATFFTGFAWNPLGVIWLPTGVAQASAWIGTYGLSGLAVGVATLSQRMVRHSIGTAAAVIGAVILVPIFWFALQNMPPLSRNAGEIEDPGAARFMNGAGPRIRIVQPNIGQDVKYSAANEIANYRKLATLTGAPTKGARLIFWPEAAIPAYLDMEPEWRRRLADLLGPDDLLMTGGDKVYFKTTDKGLYQDRMLAGANNSLWILDARARILGRYSKAHLVPYGEYLPMRQLLTPLGLSRLVPGDADFWPGPGPQTLTLPKAANRRAYKMGVQICYEIIFSGQVIDPRHRPDFLFNPSNDAWFGSWGPPQHLAQARLRAIEEGVPIVRSTPTGISAIIDANGALIKSLPHRTAGYIDGRLPPANPPTLFSRTGNGSPMALALLLIALAIARRGRPR